MRSGSKTYTEKKEAAGHPAARMWRAGAAIKQPCGLLSICFAMLLVSQTNAFSIPAFIPQASSSHRMGCRASAWSSTIFHRRATAAAWVPGAPPGGRARAMRSTLSMQVAEAADEVDKFSADTHPPYGETGGAQLLMEDVLISRGDRDLMIGVDLRLTAGERVGLVGPNGAGKSTLLSAAAGRLPVKGKVLVRPGLSLGYLIQTAVSGSERSCWEEASSQMARLNRAQQKLDDIIAQISAGDTSDAVLNAQADALAEFEAAGGYNVDEKIASVLTGLGFEQKDFKKSCTEFSGG